MNAPEFWQDKKRSEETLKEVSAIKSKIEPIESIAKSIKECIELSELAREEGDAAILEDVAGDIASVEKQLRMYTMVYPFLWAWSKLDLLLFFLRFPGKRGCPCGQHQHQRKHGAGEPAQRIQIDFHTYYPVMLNMCCPLPGTSKDIDHNRGWC